jgi:hypothetical protein
MTVIIQCHTITMLQCSPPPSIERAKHQSHINQYIAIPTACIELCEYVIELGLLFTAFHGSNTLLPPDSIVRHKNKIYCCLCYLSFKYKIQRCIRSGNYDGWWIGMDREGDGRCIIKNINRALLGETDENNEHPKSGRPMSARDSNRLPPSR